MLKVLDFLYFFLLKFISLQYVTDRNHSGSIQYSIFKY